MPAARNDLPPIFAKVRFGLPVTPYVVFHMTPEADEEAYAIASQIDNKETRADHFGVWWVEYHKVGILSVRTDDKGQHLQAWWKKAGRQDAFFIADADVSGDTFDRFTATQKLVAALYYRAAILLGSYTARDANVSVNTLTRNRARAWERQGDTLRYARLDDLRSAAGQHRQRDYQPPAEPSGIRMALHDVRGHWRTYSSGVKVWVRAHTRGDPALGRVTRVIH